MSRTKHRDVLVIRRNSGYPITVYPATRSGEKRAIEKMLWLSENWRAVGIDDEAEIVRYRIVQIEHITEGR